MSNISVLPFGSWKSSERCGKSYGVVLCWLKVVRIQQRTETVGVEGSVDENQRCAKWNDDVRM